MANNQLANCSDCGKLYVRSVREICPDCHNEIEEQYQRVHQYLRIQENRTANIVQVSEDTDVSIKQISKFIIQNRISLANLPNLGYPCDSCGEMTKEGNLCHRCKKERTNILEQLRTADTTRPNSASKEVDWTYRSSGRRDNNEN